MSYGSNLFKFKIVRNIICCVCSLCCARSCGTLYTFHVNTWKGLVLRLSLCVKSGKAPEQIYAARYNNEMKFSGYLLLKYAQNTYVVIHSTGVSALHLI